MDIPEFCRAVETYLCKKNDGHLIRVVGPSFELVSGWAAQGIPLKVAFAGIDRYCERYYRDGPRRRPVKIDFCEADVLDVFDAWRRATGVTQTADRPPEEGDASAGRRQPSLPDHLERVVTRLTSARASGAIGDEFDALIDQISAELDAARSKAGGLRGEARRELVDRLKEADRAMLSLARSRLDPAALARYEQDAGVELAPFKSSMATDAYARAHAAAVDHLVRAQFGLPLVTFD